MAATAVERIRVWPGESSEAFPQEFCAVPPTPAVLKPGQLTAEQTKQYVNDGFLIIEDYFEKSELHPLRGTIDELVDDLADKLFQAGKIKDVYKELGFLDRLTRMDQDYPGANIVLLKKVQSVPPTFQKLWANEKLLNLAEQLLGPEVWGNPVWNLRPKIPKDEVTAVPWHQDSAYLDNEMYSKFIFSAWIPLVDATVENGCLKFIRGGHRAGKMVRHTCCEGDTFYVSATKDDFEKTLDVDMSLDVVSAPVKYGGLVIFNNLIPHGSTVNKTKEIRWSLDFRWQRPGPPFGLWGLKSGILLRSKDNPDLKPDWETFNSTDRTKIQETYVDSKLVHDEFDTTLHGPWMKQWEIVRHNRHTAAFKDDPAFWELRG